MRVHQLFEDDAGVSHFRDVALRWDDVRGASQFARTYPAAGIIMRETTKEYDVARHPAPRREYVVNLGGGVDIAAGDGESRHIAQGDAVMLDDLKGNGLGATFASGAMRAFTILAVE